MLRTDLTKSSSFVRKSPLTLTKRRGQTQTLYSSLTQLESSGPVSPKNWSHDTVWALLWIQEKDSNGFNYTFIWAFYQQHFTVDEKAEYELYFTISQQEEADECVCARISTAPSLRAAAIGLAYNNFYCWNLSGFTNLHQAPPSSFSGILRNSNPGTQDVGAVKAKTYLIIC